MPRKVAVTIAGKRLELSNLDKVLYPEAGFTKGQVIDYFQRIAPVLLPHLRDRPLSLKRYPDGVEGGFFYEKRCPAHRPDWVCTREIAGGSVGPINFCLANDRQTLAWLGNIACLELHTYLYRVQHPERPTMLVFDLDPGAPAGLADCLELALALRALLAQSGLDCLAKTSGGKGLHICVPLNSAVGFDATKAFARAVAQAMEQQFPERVTSLMAKKLRTGKVFIDWSQNDRSKTTCCVYSLRARARPTVSTPVTWDEVASAQRSRRAPALDFTADQVLARVARDGDLFAPLLTLKQKLPRIESVLAEA